jgi:DNA-binding response OmpR family regulator
MQTIIAVDTDIAIYKQHVAEWAKHNIDILRANSMHDAIVRLARGEKFFFIAINEDSVPDFLIQLPIMRDATNIPIFVFTSHYTVEKKIIALEEGADMYDQIAPNAEISVSDALEQIKIQSRWQQRSLDSLPMLISGDVILSLNRRTVYINGIEVKLIKKEFDVMLYLMTNKGMFISSSKLIENIWDENRQENGTQSLWSTMTRLRNKLSELSPDKEYIKVQREVGYMFSS